MAAVNYSEMSMQIVHDRTGWPNGPWHDEPDVALWRDETTGLWCLATRQDNGAWCGYVGVLPGHGAHGLDFMDVDARFPVTAHGGLTYSSHRDDETWWLGFDCLHAGDLVPWFNLSEASLVMVEALARDEAYRTLPFVCGECTALAAALMASP